MENPVNLESGITYERSAIEKWFESGNTTCPVKKCELTTRHLTPNHNLRELIQEWKENNAKFRLENAAETLVSSGGGDGEEIEAALVELCNLCQERSSFSQIVEDKNLIPRILALTSFQMESIQLKSMECLCYIARQDSSKVIYALRSLRRRNTYQVNMVPPWHYPVSQSCGIESSSSFEQVASISLDRGLNVAVIVTNAKRKARVMVDIALQTCSDRQFPPSEVANVLDEAVRSLQPC